VFAFFQLPVPHSGGPSLGDWMTDNLARGHAEGDSVDWHGAHFRVSEMADGRVSRVALALRPRDPQAQ
jgi:cell volume regulation protein A